MNKPATGNVTRRARGAHYPLLVLACLALLLLALAPYGEYGFAGELTGLSGEQSTPCLDSPDNDNPLDGDANAAGPATPGAATTPLTRMFDCHWVEPLLETPRSRIKARAPPQSVT